MQPDTDVPFAQSEMMATELARKGVECDFVRIAGGEHGFARNMDAPQTADALNRVMAFLQKHLR